jgi:predicted nucleic acid-binding protein
LAESPDSESVLFDTNVLIAALVPAHPAHERSRTWIESARRHEVRAFVSVHSLAEFYSVVTGHLKASPAAAYQMIATDLTPYLSLVALDEKDYLALISMAAGGNIRGGTVFDVIIGWAAWKAGVDLLITLNPRHFELIFPTHSDRIVEP